MSNGKTPVAILVRVSTVKQETARQVSELRTYAESKGYEVVEVCEETISGTAENGQRHGLHRVEQLARAGKIKKVLVHEISRLHEGTVSLINLLRLWKSAACRFTGTRRRSRHCCQMESAIRPPE